MSMFEALLLGPLRRRRGQSFRKSLGVYSYKLGPPQHHKKPKLMTLFNKEALMKVIFKNKWKVYILKKILRKMIIDQK